MSTLQLRNVCKRYGSVDVINDLSLQISDGEFIVFVGPSGCGKPTLIRMIAGLEEITSGELSIDGKRVNETAPADRGLAMVFQSYALYPHMTVRQNMSFALRLAGASQEERERKVAEAARILHLENYLDHKPGQLSGGQRQRVAIGRAIVRNPKIFLTDSISAIALGSYTLAVEPVGSALLALAEREAQRTVIALDCNLRPALVGPLDAWRQRIERFARCASIIKLSDEDFASGWGDSARPNDRAARWLELGAKLVIMTHGSRGATAWHSCGRVMVPALPVKVADTVGAGDSFQAALLARLAQHGLLTSTALSKLDRNAISDALYYATFAASWTCERRGADLPRLADIDRLMVAQSNGPET